MTNLHYQAHLIDCQRYDGVTSIHDGNILHDALLYIDGIQR